MHDPIIITRRAIATVASTMLLASIAGLSAAADESHAVLFAPPGVSAPASGIQPDGEGFVVFGVFSWAGPTRVDHVARWDGERWSPLGGGVDGPITSATRSGGDLILGGLFGAAGGARTRNVARWDGEAWSAVGEGLPGAVTALTTYGETLVAAGSFDGLGRIARWNDSGWEPFDASLAGRVIVLGTSPDGGLLAGGHLTVDGEPCFLARHDGIRWRAFEPALDAPVLTMTRHAGHLVVGGAFVRASDGTPLRHVARHDGTRWTALGDGFDHDVLALRASGDRLVAGGRFLASGAESTPHLAEWTGSRWAPLSTAPNGPVQDLIPDGDAWIAVGEFDRVEVAAGTADALVFDAAGIARVGGARAASYGTASGPNARVYAASVIGDALVVAGGFDAIGSLPCSRVATYEGGRWRAMGDGVGDDVLAVAAFRGRPVIGGLFISAGHGASSGHRSLDRVARWNGRSWESLGGGVNGPVIGLLEHQDRLIVSGNFTRAGSLDVPGIAAWDGSEWTSLGPPAVNGGVIALGTHRGDLVAGGSFTIIGGVDAGGIARWTGATWEPIGHGVDGRVRAIAEHGGALFIAGDFAVADGRPASGIARWDGSTWSDVGGGVTARTTPHSAKALLSHGSWLLVGGVFERAGQTPSRNLAAWDGRRWRPLVPVRGAVHGLAVVDGALALAGRFDGIGRFRSAYLAIVPID